MNFVKLLIILLALAFAAPSMAQTVGGGPTAPAKKFEGLGSPDSIDLATSSITISGTTLKLAGGARLLNSRGDAINPSDLTRAGLVSYLFQYGSGVGGIVKPKQGNGYVTEVRVVSASRN
jgi:hypothetical protein